MKKYLAVRSVKSGKRLAAFLKTTQDELDAFFKFKAPKPLLFLLDNREDMDLIWGKKTESWFVGAFKNNGIYILSPKAYARESSHAPEEFWQTLKHEYCHYYYTQITKSHCPVWLNEGLASYVSGKRLVLKDDQKDKLADVFDYFDRSGREVYAIGQFWVEYLIKEYGKNKFLRLINSFDSGLNYHKFVITFYKIYGFKFSRVLFSKLLK